MTKTQSIAAVVAGLIGVFVVMYAVRMFSNATTPITVKEVTPGVMCASMITGDGAAISCWKMSGRGL